MFNKDLRTRNEVALKNSCRKKLKADISKYFPSLSEDDLEMLLPKGEVKIRKLYTRNGDDVTVYFGQNNPLFFEVEDIIFPTVYLLWKYPDALPVFITHAPVFDKLFNGADLMLPGVICLQDYGPKCYGTLQKNDRCSVHSTENRAPLCVGRTTLSSEDMFLSGRRGRCVNIIHSYKDKLWSMGDKSHPPSIPFVLLNDNLQEPAGYNLLEEPVIDSTQAFIDLAHQLNNALEKSIIDKEFENKDAMIDPDFGQKEDAIIEAQFGKKEEIETSDGAVGGSEIEENQVVNLIEQMDNLYYTCFLHALKKKVNKKDLPLLTSTFSRNGLHACCPREQNLEIKKSSYKKLSKFLHSMQKRGFIEVKELSKGVDSITAVNWAHPELKNFICPEIIEEEPDESSKDEPDYEPPKIIELHMVNGNTLPLFKLLNCHKGQVLEVSCIRQMLNDYIKQNELFQKDNQSIVILDPIFTDVLLNKGETLTTLRRDEIITRLLRKMQPAYSITFPHRAPEIRKGKIEPILLKVEQRTSNKKVTLIQNLEAYGIELSTISKELQIGVAASTSISPLPGKGAHSQVMVQGNQVKFIGELLLNKYKLNKKYIEGLDLAPKKK